MIPVWLFTVALILWVALVPRTTSRYGWWLVTVLLAVALFASSMHVITQGR